MVVQSGSPLFASHHSLSARNISKSYGPSVILDGVSLAVAPRDRIGVVGPNGVGKSTLLRILAGVEPPDEGSVEPSSPLTTVGYLPQEVDADPRETLRAYLARRTGVAEAERRMDALLPRGGDDTERIQAYSDAVERFVALGGEDFDARVAQVGDRLGLPGDAPGRQIGSLSGGQAARAALAAILLARFDIFLLDEPTNDLDFDGLAHLEAFLDALQSGLVVVSHDRAFLERTVTSVLELAEDARGGVEYGSGFTDYLEERARRRAARYEAYERNLEHRGRLREQAVTSREWSRAGIRRAKTSEERDKFIRHGRIAGAERAASKAVAAERKLERLERVDKPWESWRLELSFGEPARGGDIVFRLRDAVVARGSFRLGPLDLDIVSGDRVAVVGPNGSGKSTLVGALVGDIPLEAGRAYRGPGVVAATMDQPRAIFDSSDAFLDVFGRTSGLLVEDARSLLAKFGLGAEHVARSSTSLSPGERSRALLALLAARRANCLVLDEPTNHLDLPAIEQLEAALAEFPGTVLLVSHDRLLLERFRATRRLELTGDGIREVLL